MGSTFDSLSPLFNIPLDFQASPNDIRATMQQERQPAPIDPRYAEDTYVERDGKHKGVAGTARDVLGFLGDLLLTRLHMPAMYSQSQQKRKLSAAMEGFDQDPESAINRVASIDPVYGAKLREQHVDNKRLDTTRAQVNEDRDARIAIQQETKNNQIRGFGASMVNTMSGWPEDKRKENWPSLRSQVIAAGKRRGYDLTDELPETYDPMQLDAFIDSAVPVGTQRGQRLSSRRLDITEKQGDRRLDQGERKLDQGERKLDQGDRSLDQRDRIIGQGDARLQQGDVRLEQGDRSLDQRDRIIGQGDVRLEQGERRLDQTEPVIKLRRHKKTGVVYRFKLVNGKMVNLGPDK